MRDRGVLSRASIAALLIVLAGSGGLEAQAVESANLRRAVDAYQAGDMAGAEALFAAVPPTASVSDRAVSAVYRGLIAFARDSVPLARQWFTRALEAQPSLQLDPERHSPSRVSLLESVRSELVERWSGEARAAEAGGDREVALTLWTRALSARPDDGALRAAAARVAAAGDPPARRAQSDSAARAAPTRSTVPARTGGASVNPTVAVALGLAFPGAGEFYAGRPVRGLLTLAGAAGAAAAGLLIERVEVDCRSIPDNGVCPPADVLNETRTRPYLTAGIAAAAVITMLGAIDAGLGAGAASGAGDAVRVSPGGQVQLTLLRIRP